MHKVVCTSLGAETGPHFELFNADGFDVEVIPRQRQFEFTPAIMETLKDAEVVIAGSEPWTKDVLVRLPNLRVIARFGVGFDAVDLKACDECGVVVTTTPGVLHHAVAEHTIAMLMAVGRRFPSRDQQVRRGEWLRLHTPRIAGSTLGLIGLGWIGQAVATRGVGLGMTVIVYDPFPNEDFAKQWNIKYVGFDELLAQSDYVSLHCFMSPENHHLINEQTIAKMKDGAVVINTARGPIIDETALIAALKSGKLRGAGLDVFETEPLPLSSPLIEMDNVLLSGHVAGIDNESIADTFRMIHRTTMELYRGGWPKEAIRNMQGVTGWKWEK